MKILMLLFLVSCGTSHVFNKTGDYTRLKTDAEFKPYISRFREVFGYTNTPIVFKERIEWVAGTCTIWTRGIWTLYKEIQIDPDKWLGYSEKQRETLIFHELGHCHLKREHNNTEFNDGCPRSIMRYRMMNSYEIKNCYDVYKDHYMTELGNENG